MAKPTAFRGRRGHRTTLCRQGTGQTGQRVSYYGRQDQGVRMWLLNDRVTAMYVTRPPAVRTGIPDRASMPDIEAKRRAIPDQRREARERDPDVRGAPGVTWVKATSASRKRELPESYQMEYPGGFSVYVVGQAGPGTAVQYARRTRHFAYKGQLRVGLMLEQALQVMGPPDRTWKARSSASGRASSTRTSRDTRARGTTSATARACGSGQEEPSQRTVPAADRPLDRGTTFRLQVGERLANLDLNTWTYRRCRRRPGRTAG